MHYLNTRLLLLLIGLTACGSTLKAESGGYSHNIYADFFGSTNYVSVKYDTRFAHSSVFGWFAGVGYSTSKFEDGKGGLFGNNRKGIALPIGINALIGNRESKFEVGVDLNPGLYAYRDNRRVMEDIENGVLISNEDFGSTSWRPACAIGVDLGYRLQRECGFLFRIGFSPCIDINSMHSSFHLFSLIPYLSLGYTFK